MDTVRSATKVRFADPAENKKEEEDEQEEQEQEDFENNQDEEKTEVIYIWNK